MARGERGGGGHQPLTAAAMRVTEAGRPQLLARRAGQRPNGTFTQQHRNGVHATSDTMNAATATTKSHQAQPPPGMTARTTTDAGEGERDTSQRDRRRATLRRARPVAQSPRSPRRGHVDRPLRPPDDRTCTATIGFGKQSDHARRSGGAPSSSSRRHPSQSRS